MSDAEQNGEAGRCKERSCQGTGRTFNRSIVNSHRRDQTTSMKEDTGVIKTGKAKAWQEF